MRGMLKASPRPGNCSEAEVGRNSTNVSLRQNSVALRQLDNAKYASPKVYKRLRTTVRGEVLPFMSVSQWKVLDTFVAERNLFFEGGQSRA
jgi:hypothetical protein